MAPRARSKFGALILEPEVFRKPMRCIEENTCDIVGIFQRPCSDMVPGKLCAPFVTPLTVQYLVETLLNAQ